MHLRVSAWLLALGLAACAQRQNLPPGNELEFPEALSAPKDRSALDRSLPADHEAIASAFTGSVAPKEATRQQPTGPETPGQRFQRALAAAMPRLAGSDMMESTAAFGELGRVAELAGPEAQQKLYETRAYACQRNGDFSGTLEAADRWLVSCGPTHVDECRDRALAAMASAARGNDRLTIKARVAAIRKHDACVARAETGRHAPACLPLARAFYEREADELMIRRAWLAQARREKGSQAEHSYAEAERACTEARCMGPERRLLRRAIARALKRDEAQVALQMAFEEARLAFGSVTPVPRTSLIAEACSALDRSEGVGACRKAEQETRRNPFEDSWENSAGEGLPLEAVKSANERFGALIQDCLADEADRLEPPQAVRYGVSWVVLNDGRVDQVHLERKDWDEGPLASCLRTQFSVWRYPHYRGELQHVEQRFVVTARERRDFGGPSSAGRLLTK